MAFWIPMTLANSLSLLRLALLPVQAGLAFAGQAGPFLATFAAAMASDVADGQVARRLGQATPLGAKLDSIADLATLGVPPALPLLALAGRDHRAGAVARDRDRRVRAADRRRPAPLGPPHELPHVRREDLLVGDGGRRARARGRRRGRALPRGDRAARGVRRSRSSRSPSCCRAGAPTCRASSTRCARAAPRSASALACRDRVHDAHAMTQREVRLGGVTPCLRSERCERGARQWLARVLGFVEARALGE